MKVTISPFVAIVWSGYDFLRIIATISKWCRSPQYLKNRKFHLHQSRSINQTIHTMKTPANVTLRPATPRDTPLFYKVIDLTMREFILATWGRWDEERVQSEAQAHSKLPNAQVIQIDSVDVGVLVVSRYSTHIQVEQIYLLPQYQRSGIGSNLLNSIITEAAELSIPIRLRVMAVNPAKKFYEHLGFVVTETTSEFFEMEKMP
jgi:GNAT superfamily N-acetyltransferase